MNIHEAEDLGLAMHKAAEAHMAKVWAAHYLREEAEDGGPSPEMIDTLDPAVGPFCGCETCVVREVLAGAWPVIAAHMKTQKPTATCRCAGSTRSIPHSIESSRSLAVSVSVDPVEPSDWANEIVRPPQTS